MSRGGAHLASHVPTFVHSERALFLRLILQLCTNPENSYNKLLYKSLFLEMHSMLEISERLKINKLKDKLRDLSHVGSDIDVINHILNHKIIPCISSYGIKKLLDRTPIKCQP